MIRNVVVGRLKPGVELSAVEPALEALRGLEVDGLLDLRLGTDLRLREQSWDFAITADFVDEAAYRAYDADAEHNRIRSEMFALVCEQIVRVQLQA